MRGEGGLAATPLPAAAAPRTLAQVLLRREGGARVRRNNNSAMMRNE